MRALLCLNFLLFLLNGCVSWESPDLDGDGLKPSEGDCDDLDAGASPDQAEIWYDGIDQNCDGNDADKDGDGFDSWQVGGPDCWDDPDSPPPGFEVVAPEWTQPTAAEVHPEANEAWYDGIDQNCDGADDFDQDFDGYRSSKHADASGQLGEDCVDGSDLDDPNPAGLQPEDIHPGVATDECYDGTNADCDELEADALNENASDYDSDYDCDGDGWMISEECDDQDASIEPNDDPDEFGDCVDANCDGNDGDEDGDGYVTDAYAAACTNWQEMDGHIGAGDCWDSGPAGSDFTPINGFDALEALEVNPSATERYYDAIDQDCDGQSDFDADSDAENTSDYKDRSGQRGDDCDDGNNAINSGVQEDCTTAFDDNCDGETNNINANSCVSFWQDADADNYGAEGSQARCYCEAKVNVSKNEYYRATNDDDCNDSVYAINPGAAEQTGDSVDSDCDGTEVCYEDSDNDGYANGSATVSSADSDCLDSGEATLNQPQTDCDDSDANTNPGATEYCDGHDDDCDGNTDEDDAADASTWFRDSDSDTYGDPNNSKNSCSQPNGYVSDNTDCRPTDSNAYPGADEYCDGHDDDCDGSTDESNSIDASTWYRDSDNDGFGTPSNTKTQCYQPTGYVSDNTDCLDSNIGVNPSATEVCDAANLDEDCDGGADDLDPNGTPSSGSTNYYPDADIDSFGDASASPSEYCDAPNNGSVTDNTDCDDTSSSTYPGAASNDPATACTRDADSDGYGDANAASPVDAGSDCDDTNSSINPGGTEICDAGNNDEDCDGGSDDNDPEGPVSGGSLYYIDADIDGYGCSTCTGLRVCDTPPSNYVADNSDCDEGDLNINPGAHETACDSIDSDCDGEDSAFTITDLAPGDLVITEILIDPKGKDREREFFELLNVSGMELDLDGLEIDSNPNQGIDVNTCLAMEPDELLLFVRSDDSSLNGGLTADFGLNNKVGFWNTGPDNLRVAVNGTTIDEITWLPADVEEGYSLALHPNNHNATDNDDLSYWCDGTFEFTSNNFGSPGTANELCGESIATQVQPMFNSECTSCHSGSSASASLDLSSANAWDNLVGVSSPQNGSYALVEPFDAANSWLFIKVQGNQGSGNGGQMPKGSSALPAADIAAVQDWINDGAWR